jgi:hypothetical protein
VLLGGVKGPRTLSCEGKGAGWSVGRSVLVWPEIARDRATEAGSPGPVDDRSSRPAHHTVWQGGKPLSGRRGARASSLGYFGGLGPAGDGSLGKVQNLDRKEFTRSVSRKRSVRRANERSRSDSRRRGGFCTS